MPNLSQLTDAYTPQETVDSFPVESPFTSVPVDVDGVRRVRIDTAPPKPEPSFLDNIGMAGVDDKSGKSEHPLLQQLFGLGGETRYQLWPERMVREGLSAAGDVMSGKVPQWAIDPETGDVHTSPNMVEKAQEMSALAGTGGLAGMTTDATLGATPFLRPALKYKDKLYKGKDGQQHLDVIPESIYPEFQKKAMSGEDINEFKFGFVNDKGHFLNREDALKYGIDTGLVDPQAGKFGALTSTLMADSSKPGIAIESMKQANPFFSAVEHNVNAIPQAKMTGDQWLGTLSNKPGVKPEEMQWSGLSDFLKENKGKPVTKEQIQEHLAQNKVELKEIQKGNPELKQAALALQKEVGDSAIVKGQKLYPDEVEQGLWDGSLTPKDLPTNLQPHAEKMLALREVQNEHTKYHGYQLPGGENYREMLLTLPSKSIAADKEAMESVAKLVHNKPYAELTKAQQENVERMALVGNPASKAHDYKSSHWDEPNILAHVRMNDRTIDGKKSLHLEEIQSDAHQTARDKGYVDSKNPYEVFDPATAEVKGKYATEAEAKAAATNGLDYSKSQGIPDLPFKKTWHELALKRMLREAADKNYDRLSWTSGEHHPTNPKNLKQTGPEADKADKGMQGFYNDILPKAVEKLGKEYGVKVKTHELETNPKGWHITPPTETVSGKWMVKSNDYNSKGWHFDTKAEAEANLAQNIAGEKGTKKIHYIDIPQGLKDAALNKGFPLFSSGGFMLMPVDHDPFADKK